MAGPELPKLKTWVRFPSPAPLAAAALAAALLLPGCAALDAKQREWIFRPSDRAWGNAAALAEGMEDVWIEFASRETGQSARLHGLWLPQDDRPDAPVLLYLHGARWDVRGSAPRMRRLHQLGFAVLGVDYRGFGRSLGGDLPSEAMAYEDARAAWDWLAQHHPGRPRYVFGHSLGGAIAVQLAATAPGVAGLMVEGTFTSIADVLDRTPWGWVPVGPLLTQRFESARHIAQVRSPVLVVHGSQDRTIAPELGRALYERAPGRKRFLLVEGGTHHNTNAVGLDQYRAAVAELFGIGNARGE